MKTLLEYKGYNNGIIIEIAEPFNPYFGFILFNSVRLLCAHFRLNLLLFLRQFKKKSIHYFTSDNGIQNINEMIVLNRVNCISKRKFVTIIEINE